MSQNGKLRQLSMKFVDVFIIKIANIQMFRVKTAEKMFSKIRNSALKVAITQTLFSFFAKKLPYMILSLQLGTSVSLPVQQQR